MRDNPAQGTSHAQCLTSFGRGTDRNAALQVRSTSCTTTWAAQHTHLGIGADRAAGACCAHRPLGCAPALLGYVTQPLQHPYFLLLVPVGSLHQLQGRDWQDASAGMPCSDSLFKLCRHRPDLSGLTLQAAGQRLVAVSMGMSCSGCVDPSLASLGCRYWHLIPVGLLKELQGTQVYPLMPARDARVDLQQVQDTWYCPGMMSPSLSRIRSLRYPASCPLTSAALWDGCPFTNTGQGARHLARAVLRFSDQPQASALAAGPQGLQQHLE